MVVTAARGDYPASLFDVVMGLNRWCFRVLAYAALLRDEYPPFRFDAGGTDPGVRGGTDRAHARWCRLAGPRLTVMAVKSG